MMVMVTSTPASAPRDGPAGALDAGCCGSLPDDLISCNPHLPGRSASFTPPDSPVEWGGAFGGFDDMLCSSSPGAAAAEMQARAAAAAALSSRPHRDSYTPPDSPVPFRKGGGSPATFRPLGGGGGGGGSPAHFHELLHGFADLATTSNAHATNNAHAARPHHGDTHALVDFMLVSEKLAPLETMLSPPASPSLARRAVSPQPEPPSALFASLPWGAAAGMLDLSVDVIADAATADADTTTPNADAATPDAATPNAATTPDATTPDATPRAAPSKRKRTYKTLRRNADPKSAAEHLERMREKRAAKREKRTAEVDKAVDELPPLEGGLASCTDPELRRRFHNVLEGKRRNDLKNSYEWLHEVLPTLKHRERVPTSQILLHAVDCVQELQDAEVALAHAVADAKAQNQRLKQLLGMAH